MVHVVCELRRELRVNWNNAEDLDGNVALKRVWQILKVMIKYDVLNQNCNIKCKVTT